MKASELITRLNEAVAEHGDIEVFRSHGNHSREVIDAEITQMCSQSEDLHWMRCQVASCERTDRQTGVLIL